MPPLAVPGARAAPVSGYMKQLDGLRGLAVFAVVLSHFPPHPLVERLLPWGILGVQLFFVLSGFLITGILLRSKDIVARGAATHGSVWRSFYVRRMLRIFPLYYATLLILFALNLCDVRPVIGYQLSYLINFHIASTGLKVGSTTHFWSLAVEEQFYLCWPLAVYFLNRKALLRLLSAVIVLAPIVRFAILSTFADTELARRIAYVLTPARADGLAFGALVAILLREPRFRAAINGMLGK